MNHVYEKGLTKRIQNIFANSNVKTQGRVLKTEYTKSQLNEINTERYRGAIVRARAENYMCGEQPTRRALAGEKKYALSKEINIIESEPLLTSGKAAI